MHYSQRYSWRRQERLAWVPSLSNTWRLGGKVPVEELKGGVDKVAAEVGKWNLQEGKSDALCQLVMTGDDKSSEKWEVSRQRWPQKQGWAGSPGFRGFLRWNSVQGKVAISTSSSMSHQGQVAPESQCDGNVFCFRGKLWNTNQTGTVGQRMIGKVTYTQTRGWLCCPSDPLLGKALPLPWGWVTGVLDMAIFMSTIYIHSFRTSLLPTPK